MLLISIFNHFVSLSNKLLSDRMSIFKNKTEFDKYKDKTVVLNSIRTDKATAIKIDELVQVCTSEKGKRVSKNQLLTGIVVSFINGIESTAQTNEDLAIKQLMAVLVVTGAGYLWVNPKILLVISG